MPKKLCKTLKDVFLLLQTSSNTITHLELDHRTETLTITYQPKPAFEGAVEISVEEMEDIIPDELKDKLSISKHKTRPLEAGD